MFIYVSCVILQIYSKISKTGFTNDRERIFYKGPANMARNFKPGPFGSRFGRPIRIPEKHSEMRVMKARTQKYSDFLKNEQTSAEIIGFVNFHPQNMKFICGNKLKKLFAAAVRCKFEL